MKSFSLPTHTATRSISPSTSPSPPTFSPPPYSQSPRSRSPRHSRLHSLLHTTFLALSLLALIFSVAIIACTASSLRSYHHTDLPHAWYLQLWPEDLDLRPTRALLATGVIVAVASLANLLVALVPSLHSPPTLLPTLLPLTTTLLLLLLPLSIFALSFSHALNNVDGAAPSGAVAGTLQSWTCNFRAFAAIAPMGFVDICRETRAAVDLVAVLVVLELAALACAGVGWWVERRGRKGGRGRGVEETKLDEFS